MMRNIIYTIAALCTVFVSCSEDNIGAIYDGTENAGFAFGSLVLNIEAAPEDGNEILIPVYRSNTKVNMAEISFAYDCSESSSSDPDWKEADPNGIFSLTTKRVIFPDNSYTAYARVRYKDISDLDPLGKYRMKLKINSQLSPSKKGEVVITAGRKLTFVKLGKCMWHDACLFDNAYETEIYKAQEGEIYRVMDPYTKGLIAEEYADAGWMLSPPEYVQFMCDENGFITYEPFKTGMMLNGLYMAYAYYPGEYQWGRDFSDFNKENKKISDTEYQLYPVYCLPDYQYGFLNDGAYKLTITLK